MEADYSGSSYPEHSTGLFDTVYRCPMGQKVGAICLQRQREGHHHDRDRFPIVQGSYSAGWERGRLHQQCLPGSKRRQQVEAYSQPEGTECSRSLRALQDGGHSLCEGLVEQRRVYVQARPKGCIPFGSSPSGASKVPAFRMARESVRVQRTPLWFGKCSKDIHEGDEASACNTESSGHKSRGLSRRSLDCRQGQEVCRRCFSVRKSPPGGIGICSEFREVSGRGHTKDRVLGVPDRLQNYEVHSSPFQGEGNSEGSQADATRAESDSEAIGTHHWDDGCHQSGSASSTVALPGIARPKNSRSSPPPLIRVIDHARQGVPERPELVDQASSTMEWERYPLPSTSNGNRVGCLQFGMGSSFWDPGNWRPVVQRRARSSYQCEGVAGSLPCTPDFCEASEECSRVAEDGQPGSSVLHQSHGGYTFTTTDEPYITDLGVELTQENLPVSGASPRQIEPDCRSAVQDEDRLIGVEPASRGFQEGDTQSGPLPGRPLGVKAHSTVTDIHELETRSRSNSCRCSLPAMEVSEALCIPPICFDRQVSKQGKTRDGARAGISSTSMANSTMVSCPHDNDDPRSNHLTMERQPTDEPKRGISPITEGKILPVGRVDSVRSSLQSRGVSQEAADLILASWRKSTEAAYSCSWRRWQRWCGQHDHNSLCAPLSAILSFLAEEFANGKQYRTVNSYRSAISMTHNPIDGVVIGKHPLVSRLLKGVYNLRPPKPRYSFTWDVKIVLDYLRSWGPTASLSLKKLTQKLVMLLALANASRSSELHALSTSSMIWGSQGVTFTLLKPTKSSRPGKDPMTISYPCYHERILCPVTTLERYLDVTKGHRSSNQLFLSYVKPFGPIASSSIARWLKDLLLEAGLDSTFRAHSVRGAAVSAARLHGMSVADIVSVADWTSDTMFKKFYYRPVAESKKSLLPFVINNSK